MVTGVLAGTVPSVLLRSWITLIEERLALKTGMEASAGALPSALASTATKTHLILDKVSRQAINGPPRRVAHVWSGLHCPLFSVLADKSHISRSKPECPVSWIKSIPEGEPHSKEIYKIGRHPIRGGLWGFDTRTECGFY
jgi:hypothetical protein